MHIPFCEKKCIYCDFYSIEDKSQIENFLIALHHEIDLNSEITNGEKIETIFFGGGTPSLLDTKSIKDILLHIKRVFNIQPNAEITIEINPGTIDEIKLSKYFEMGINRLSIGVQSFHEKDLRTLTRIHSVSQAIQTITTAKKVGYDNISIDLIYAIPGQTKSSWMENLKLAVNFEPQHISAYSLIIEENTPMEQMVRTKIISPTDSELEADMYALTMETLIGSGYIHYEVSNYSKPNFECRHNRNYWNHSNYFGIGPSAHSFINLKRWWNVRDLTSYCQMLNLNKLPIAGSEILSHEEMLNESIMFGIRQGILNLNELKSQYSIKLNYYLSDLINQLQLNAYLTYDAGVIKLSDKGFLICDTIIEKLMSCILPE